MVREFVFKEYPQHDVGRLNLIEITLVCNECEFSFFVLMRAIDFN